MKSNQFYLSIAALSAAIGIAMTPAVAFAGPFDNEDQHDVYAPERPGRPDRPRRPDRPGRPDRDDGYRKIVQRKADQITNDLYIAILFRQADQQGLYTRSQVIQREGIRGIQRMAYEMGSGDDFNRGVLDHYTPIQVVSNAYRVLLGRKARQHEAKSWIQMVRNGRGGEAIRGIISTEEFLRRYNLR